MARAKNDNPLLETPFGIPVMNHWQKHRPRAMQALGNQAPAAMLAAAEQAEEAFRRLRSETGDAEMAREVAMHEFVLLPDLDSEPPSDELATTESNPAT